MDDLTAFFTAARRQQVDTSRMEFALETRVLSHIRQKRAGSEEPCGSFWKWLLPTFTCIAILSGFWYESAWQTTDDTVFRIISTKSDSTDGWIF